jgi:hypothetical protein
MWAPYNDIGIVHIAVVQPSLSSIDKQATVSVGVYRRAEKRVQAIDVTNRIREIMQSGAQQLP